MKKSVGIMIQDTVSDKHIKQRALGRGLCSIGDLSKFLNGTKRMDCLLMTALLQRIGKSAANFSVLLTEEEYIYFDWRHQMCLAQLERDWKRMEQLLEENAEIYRTLNETLQRQYVLLIRAILEEKRYHNRAQAEKLLLEAIRMTIPEFAGTLPDSALLCRQELYAILLWQKLQPDEACSAHLLEQLLLYLEKGDIDRSEFARIYPRVALQYLNLLKGREAFETCLMLSDRVIELIVKTGYAEGLEQFLDIYVASAEAMGCLQKADERKKQLDAMRELLSVLGENPINSEETLFLMDAGQEVELLQQTLSVSRQEQKRTQESLCEGICEPETISRIERGKHMPHPKTYAALAQRLNLPTQKYYSSIETGDFRILELQWMLEVSISNREWEEAENKLHEIRECLDVMTNRNRQYLEQKQYIISKRKATGKDGKEIDRLVSILQLTMPQATRQSWEEDEFWKHFFTKTEMQVMMAIADVLYSEGNYVRALQLLEKMDGYYAQKRVAQEYHYKIILLILARLTSALLQCEEYDKAIIVIQQGIQISFQCCNQLLIGGLVNNWAHALEHTGHPQEALRLYRLAYYYNELMDSPSAKISRESYHKLMADLSEGITQDRPANH